MLFVFLKATWGQKKNLNKLSIFDYRKYQNNYYSYVDEAAHPESSPTTLEPSSTQALFRDWKAHQHIHASATGDRKQLDALPPPTLGPTDFFLSSPLTAPSHFSARWLLTSCLSGFTYRGKQVEVVVERGSLIHTQDPQRVSSIPFMSWEPSYSQNTLLQFL